MLTCIWSIFDYHLIDIILSKSVQFVISRRRTIVGAYWTNCISNNPSVHTSKGFPRTILSSRGISQTNNSTHYIGILKITVFVVVLKSTTKVGNVLRVTYSTKASLYPSYLSFVISCLSTLSIMGYLFKIGKGF